jgi:hypothetical protein
MESQQVQKLVLEKVCEMYKQTSLSSRENTTFAVLNSASNLYNYASSLNIRKIERENPNPNSDPSGEMSLILNQFEPAIGKLDSVINTLKELLPATAASEQGEQNAKNTFSISHITHDDLGIYKVGIEYYGKEDLKELKIYFVADDCELPLLTIDEIKAHSKNEVKVKIPLPTFLKCGIGKIVLKDDVENMLAERIVSLVELIEIIPGDDCSQVKFRNNTPIMINASIVEEKTGNEMTSVDAPSSQVLMTRMDRVAGTFVVKMNGKRISNEVIVNT